jgi:hypothetical protein
MEEEKHERDHPSHEESSRREEHSHEHFKREEEKPEPKKEMRFESKNEIKIDNKPFKNSNPNSWMIATAIVGIIAIILLVMLVTGSGGSSITGKVAGEKVIEYLNVKTGGGVEFISTEDIGNLYQVTVSYNSQEIPVFVTKDGEYFVQGAVPLTLTPATPSGNSPTQTPPEVVKSDKPVVDLFIMTHCPYGTQAEKGIMPVFELLGDKIDSNFKFIHYFMHENPGQEPDETPIQICIREEEPDKFRDYLTCFLEDGDSARCVTETKIDQTKLNKCKETKADDYYATDSKESEDAGVRGSPTLIINGEQVSSARSPSAYLATICSAFNTPPEECEEVLSTANPSAGFGYTAQAGGSTNAQC